MVGQTEARRLAWLWLHNILGWKHVYFLSMGLTFDSSGQLNMDSIISVNKINDDCDDDDDKDELLLDDDDEINSIFANASHFSHITNFTTMTIKSNDRQRKSCDNANNLYLPSSITYTNYLYKYYFVHLKIIKLLSLYVGNLFGWREPWIVQTPQKILRNLNSYKKTSSYPSQSLSNDYNISNMKYMNKHNYNNILTDCLLVSTVSSGYWLGNILTGEWYNLGIETPRLPNLRSAVLRNSMSIDLFPRSNRLYFSGGFVMGMPISTIAELDLDSMRLGPVSEMLLPRAYPSQVFFPDSLVLIGGTNCWGDVYGDVEQYDFLKQKWYKLRSLKYPRYGNAAVTISEKYIFIVGGCNRFYPQMNCELYDRQTRKWTDYGGFILSPSLRSYALKYREDIFLVGKKDRCVQIFNIYKNKWSFGPKLNYLYNRGCKLCTFDYKLCAMNQNSIEKYEIYDKNSNRWYATNIRNHPVNKLYPKPFMHQNEIFDWFHLGRRYW